MKYGLAWWTMFVLACIAALYGFAVAMLGSRIYPRILAASFRARPFGIHPHAFFGSLALVLGPWQLLPRLRARRRQLHRVMGRIYGGACLVTGCAGLYMARYAIGGMTARVGFASLAVCLLGTTVAGIAAARRRDIDTHSRLMLWSYALLFAGVTLRIELPLLSIAMGAFVPAYRIIAWVCWIPNLAWAMWYSRRLPAPLPIPIGI